MSVRSDRPRTWNRTTTMASLAIVGLFVALGTLRPDAAATAFEQAQSSVLLGFKWYFIAVVGFVLAFVIWLGFGRYKNVRLGGDEERPEFTHLS